MIVWLASYPRSGNTFVRVLLYQVFGISSCSRYGPLLTGPGRPTLRARSEGPEPTLDEARADARVHVFKTHEPTEGDEPAIYIVRDGRDALVSHAHYVVNYDWDVPPDEQPGRFVEALDMLIDTETSFGGWGANVSAWLGRSAPTAVVRFEDLLGAPVETTQTALERIDFAGRKRRIGRLPTFGELQSRYPKYFRRGRIGAWRDDMSDDQLARFWRRYGDAMRQAGYAEPS